MMESDKWCGQVKGLVNLIVGSNQVFYIRNHSFQIYENAVRVRRVCRLDGSLFVRESTLKGFAIKSLYSIDLTFYNVYCF
jgi:hypothetical protein